MPKIATLNSVYPTDCATLLALRSDYAKCVYFINKGYICYYLGKERKPFEHRLVAERAFGAIPEGYHVHHINSQRFDNRVVNLELVSPDEHMQHHGQLRDQSEQRNCAYCGRPVSVSQSRLARNKVFYCNRGCRGLAERRSERPDKDSLLDLLTSLGNWRAIGRLYGVSDNAVRKWAKRYQINISAFDGRKAGGHGFEPRLDGPEPPVLPIELSPSNS